MSPSERAERAKKLLEDPVVDMALNDIRMGLVSRLETCPIGDVDTQHEIALTLQVLKQLRERLAKYGDEVAIDQHREKHDKWIARARQSLGIR